jgi:uncharacterized protein YhjY with autotransporter beta-barrel domain
MCKAKPINNWTKCNVAQFSNLIQIALLIFQEIHMQKSTFDSMSGALSIKYKQAVVGYGLQIALGLVISLGVTESATAGFNPNQQAVNVALDNCINQSQLGDRTPPDICIAGTIESNVKSLNPDQIFGMGSMAARVNGGKTTQPSDYFKLKNRKYKGGSAGDEDFSRLNIWGKVDNDFGSRYTTPKLTGFDFDNHNFVAGADYRLQDNWVAGSLFSYRHNNASFDEHRGETVNDSYTGGLYTSYNITDALHVEATASYAGFDYDTSRNINLVNFGSSVAKGTTSGGQYAFSWGGGYDFNFDALTIAPYARGDYMNLDINDYSETGSIGAVHFGKQTIESMTSTAGIQTAYTFSVPWGVLIPQLRGEWHHQFLDGRRFIQANFITDPTRQSFTMTGGLPTRDYYTFGAEVSTVLPGGVSAFLAYETLQGYTDINSNKFMLGTRLEF